MNFIINKTRIVSVLSKLQGMVGKNSNLAITENVLIEAKNNQIVVKATDLETSFEGYYQAKVLKSGLIAVNAKKLYEILKQFPDSNVLIEEIENKKIRVSNSKICYDILGCNPSDFPEITGINNSNFLQIDTVSLRSMIKRTTIISSTSGEKRAHICGVLLETDKSNENNIIILRMVSTDANRLSVVSCKLQNNSKIKNYNNKILIPKKGLNEVIKFIDADEVLKIGIKNNIFIVKKKNETVVVRLLEGDFPNYEEIIDKTNSIVIKLSKYDFAKTLKRMSILTSEVNSGIVFTFSRGKMIVITKNKEYGESKEEVEIDFFGEKIKAAFNPKFLLDTLSVMEGEDVFINIIDGNKPCILHGLNENSFISVIMPMRI